MNDTASTERPRVGERLVRFVDWLEDRLSPAIGSPPLGPYDAVVERVAVATCPVCRRPMAEHVIDHRTANAILHCPAEPIPEHESTEPLNELGMPRR